MISANCNELVDGSKHDACNRCSSHVTTHLTRLVRLLASTWKNTAWWIFKFQNFLHMIFLYLEKAEAEKMNSPTKWLHPLTMPTSFLLNKRAVNGVPHIASYILYCLFLWHVWELLEIHITMPFGKAFSNSCAYHSCPNLCRNMPYTRDRREDDSLLDIFIRDIWRKAVLCNNKSDIWW